MNQIDSKYERSQKIELVQLAMSVTMETLTQGIPVSHSSYTFVSVFAKSGGDVL